MTDQPLVQFSTPIRATDEYQVVVRPTTLAEVDLAKAIIAKALLELAGPIKALAQGLKAAPATAVELLQQELGAVVLTEIPAPQEAPQGYVSPQAFIQKAAQQAIPGPLGLGWTQPGDVQQAAQQAGVPQGPQAPANAFNPQGYYQTPTGPDMTQQGFAPPANAHQMNQGGNYGQPAPQWAGQAPQQPQAAPQAPAQGETGQCWACGKNRVCPDCGGPTVHKAIESRAGKKINLHDCVKGQRHKGVWCRTPIFRSAQQQATQQGIQLPQGLVYEQ